MIPRQLEPTLRRLLLGFPIVTITGPRQSGKTTLARFVFDGRPYVSLESLATRQFAENDPARFLAQFPNGAVIDEAQHAQNLLSELQTLTDIDGRMGLFVLTGSQNLSLVARVTQSLAGRNAIIELLPLSLAELRQNNKVIGAFDDVLCKGFYPAIHHRKVTAYDWLLSYITSYVERDARQISAIQNLSVFTRFVSLCAARTAQLVNVAALANEAGIAEGTARTWLSILETCYLIHWVRPHHENFGKRLTKSAKLYFTDVGLCAALVGIQTPEHCHVHPLRGALFETLVIGEFLKARCNNGKRETLYFWRDHLGVEIDLILEKQGALAAIEVKSSISLASDAFKNLTVWKKYASSRRTALYSGVVYGGQAQFETDEVSVLPWGLL
jgi:uncharacterized protein